MTFTVTLDKAPTEAITVNYATQTTGTATSGTDFAAATGTLTFGIGETSKTVTVSVVGDTAVESNETVQVLFSGTKLAASVTATGTITNDDTAPNFVLTMGKDDGAAFTGTDADETFTAAVLTANDGDSLTGGDGNDTLNVETSTSLTENFKTASIETVNVTALGAVTVDTKNMTGLTTLNNNDSTGAVTVNNIASAATAFGLKGSATNSLALSYATGALNGAADKLTVKLNGATAAAVTATTGFESVEVNTTAASDLATLTATGATAVTLSGSAALTLAAAVIDAFDDITVTNTAKVTYNDIATVKTFSASANTAGIVGKDLVASTGLDNGTTADKLTLSSNGSLVQTGSGNDNINVDSSALLSTSNAVIKLGAGNDILALTAGTSGEFVYAEAGDDTIYLAAATTAADLVDGGEGTDTLNLLGNDLTYAMIAKGIEKVNVGTATKDTTVNFVSIDSAIAIGDSTDDAVTFTNLRNGTTYTSTVAKDEALSLGFRSGEAATLNVNLTKGSASTVTTTNVADVTVTYGAASAAGAITMDAAATKLTVAATGALTGSPAIAASGAEKLQTVTVTGDKDVTLGNITNDAVLTSVSVKSTGGAVTVGTVGDAANTAADFTVTKIEAISTAGKAVIGNIDFSGVATTTTGLISEITASGTAGTAAATTIGNIVADKLGTVTATSSNDNATIGNITAGGDTAIAAGVDGTVTALKASGFKVATIGAVNADKVGSIIVESTDTTTGGAASVGAISDGNDTAAGTSIADIGTIDISSKKDAASTGTIDAAALGNVTVTGDTTATTGAITVNNAANTSVMGNLTVTSRTGAATLGAIVADVAGTITAKSTEAGVVVGAMTFEDATGVTIDLNAKTTVGFDNVKIENTKGDLSITAKAGETFAVGAGGSAKVNAGGTTVSDIDIVVDASLVVGAIGGTTQMVVTNDATDAASSIIVKGGQDANKIDLDGDGGTITYYGQTKVDTINLLGTYTSSTIYLEAGNDVFVGGAGVDSVSGAAGDDTITGAAGADVLDGGAGDDTFKYDTQALFVASGAIVDSIVGGDGTADTIQFAGTNPAITVAGTDSWARVSGVEKITIAGANTSAISLTLDTTAFTAGIRTVDLSGDSSATGANVIDVSENTTTTIGLTLTGSAGVDSITGGSGNDTISGASGGADVLKGGAGVDSISLTNNTTGATVVGGDGNDSIALGTSTKATDTVVFTGTGTIASGTVNVDTITNFFTSDASGDVTSEDVMQFGSTWLGVGFTSASVHGSIAADASFAAAQDGKIGWVSGAIAGSAFDQASEVKAFLNADMSSVDVEMIIIGGSDNAQVWFYDGGLDGAAAISDNDFVLIGVLTGTNTNALGAHNFGAAVA